VVSNVKSLENRFVAYQTENNKRFDDFEITVKKFIDTFEANVNDHFRLMDNKFYERIRQVDDRISKLDDRVTSLQNELTEFKQEMTEFKQEMTEFKQEMTEFKQEMTEFKQEMTEFKQEVTGRLDRMEGLLVQVLQRLPEKS